MNLPALKAGLNRYFLDGANGFFSKETVVVLAGEDSPAVSAQLEEWQQRGLLTIIKPLNEAKGYDVCIEMRKFIDMKSPIPGWPPED